MQIRVGYELVYQFPQPTPMIMALGVHYSRASDMLRPDHMMVSPSVPIGYFRDLFGNWCTRILAPAGRVRITADAVVNDAGLRDPVVPDAQQFPIQALPDDALTFLLASRYCETELLADAASTRRAWEAFNERKGVCRDYAHLAVTLCRCLNIPARYCTVYLGDMGE